MIWSLSRLWHSTTAAGGSVTAGATTVRRCRCAQHVAFNVCIPLAPAAGPALPIHPPQMPSWSASRASGDTLASAQLGRLAWACRCLCMASKWRPPRVHPSVASAPLRACVCACVSSRQGRRAAAVEHHSPLDLRTIRAGATRRASSDRRARHPSGLCLPARHHLSASVTCQTQTSLAAWVMLRGGDCAWSLSCGAEAVHLRGAE